MQPSYEYVKSTKELKERQDWPHYFMNLARLAAERSTCDRANVGAIIVNKENRIVATGYNGSVGRKTPHCSEVGHAMRDGHCIATQHAELNCISYCAKEGIPVRDCTIYVTHFPCLNCTKAIIQSGITKIYYKVGYRMDDFALHLLDINGILYEQVLAGEEGLESE
ncbi:cytidine/deoxycytidylate deaminase family protein [Clostridiaceae bacterium HFYG-1003]|nr:cytidine/deoxycytidylate deaminase family protein [Clostridiaceae bacterium HFYG-1003]